jgi:ABC-type uncharacterized transport system substrate-binding protein
VNYVDRILRGAKPSDLPVEQATKLDLMVNLKTAKTLGLTVPPSLPALRAANDVNDQVFLREPPGSDAPPQGRDRAAA